MEQNTKNLVWINIITIFIGAIASFLLYFFGWVASITSFITMYVLILIYIKYCKKLPSKKILAGLIITVCLTHILSIVFSLFVTTAIANKISLAAAFALVASTFVSYVIVLALSITLTIAMSLFGTLSAYQFHKKIHQSVQLITEKEAQTENEQVQQQEQSEHEQETQENENNIKE